LAKKTTTKNTITKRLIGLTEAAQVAGVTCATIINWERNELLEAAVEMAPRDRGRPGKLYRAADIRRVAKARAR
jgi:hypothetical protein